MTGNKKWNMEDVKNISENSVRVKEKGFMGSTHKVTGEELNKVIEDNSKKIIEINNIVYEQKCLIEKLCNILNTLDDKYARLYIEIIINQIEELLRRFQNIETEFSRQINEWNIKFEKIKEDIAQLQSNNERVLREHRNKLNILNEKTASALRLKEDIAQLQSNNETLLDRVQNLEKAINKKSFLDTMWYKASVGIAALVALGLSIFSIL